jgi:hypothetical protein
VRDFTRGESEMRNEETRFGVNDIFLLLFVVVAGWLLLFQSNLF